MNSFADLNLDPSILRALGEMGIETPSPIQAEALPMLLGEPTDFIGLAATGTGKTAAFAIPMLTRLDPAARQVQALILCPTRELAVQVAGQIDLIGKYMNVRALPIYGGASYDTQINGIRRGAQIVVGTPGRVVDHMERGTLDLSRVRTVILDEADEMISMGFKDALEMILSHVTDEAALRWLFSATMSREVRRVADTYLNEPAQVQVNQEERIPEAVEQLYYATSESNKPEVLCKLMDAAPDFYGIIFCQTKALVTDLTQYLKGRDYRVDCLHGDMDQKARERTMKAFRDQSFSVLVATDVACRGLDVKDLTHVINYSIPRELEHYVHRIGRTGRSGKAGMALSLVTPSHRGLIPRIERLTQRKMKEGKIPTRKEIGALKIASALSNFQSQATFDRAVQLLSPEWKTALEGMSKEEIAGRFLANQYPEVFSASDSREEAPRSAPSRPMPTGVVIQMPPSRGEPARAPKASGYVPRKAIAPLSHAAAPVVVAPVAAEQTVEAPVVTAAAVAPVAMAETTAAVETPSVVPHQPMTLESLMAAAEAPVAAASDESEADSHFDAEEETVKAAPAVVAPVAVAKPRREPRSPYTPKPAFERRERPAYGREDSRPAYGKPAFGGKPSFGKPSFGKPSFGAKPSYGRPAYDRGEKPSFGAPRFGAKPRFGGEGEASSFGRPAPADRGGYRPRAAEGESRGSASRYGAPRSSEGFAPSDGGGYFPKPKRAKGSVNGAGPGELPRNARGSRW